DASADGSSRGRTDVGAPRLRQSAARYAAMTFRCGSSSKASECRKDARRIEIRGYPRIAQGGACPRRTLCVKADPSEPRDEHGFLGSLVYKEGVSMLLPRPR